ncbi:MAG TPA: hypothetical protein VKA02_09560 [Candidatus Acidoferrum sp.]|nr:hypothetical protein [Candidatus Acidoferrum sp.]
MKKAGDQSPAVCHYAILYVHYYTTTAAPPSSKTFKRNFGTATAAWTTATRIACSCWAARSRAAMCTANGWGLKTNQMEGAIWL